MAKGTSSRFPFATGRAADWTYFTWETRTNADGSTTVTVNYRMRHTYWLQGTWSFYMTCNGVRKEFRHYFNKMNDTPVDVLIGSHSFNVSYSQYNASNPKAIPVTIDTTINGLHINNGGNKLMGRSTGTNNVTADLWSAPSITRATLKATGETTVEVDTAINANPSGLYIIEIALSQVGTSTKYTKTSARGATSLKNVFSGLKPYTQYSAVVTVSETRNLVTRPITRNIAGAYTPDSLPRIVSEVKISEVGITSMRATISVSSNTPVTYEFSINGGSYQKSSTNSMLFSGLTQNTSYTIRARVTNAGGNRVSTATAKTKFSPPTTPQVTVSNVGNTSAKVSAKSTSVVGLSTYQLSIDGGRSYIQSSASGEFNLSNLAPGTTYQVLVRAIDSQGFSTLSVVKSFRTIFLPPKLLSVTLKPMSSKSAILSTSAEAQAGIKSYNVSPTAPATTRGVAGPSTMIYSTPGSTVTVKVSVTDNDNQVTGQQTVSVSLPEETITEVMTKAVPVKFIRNTTDILKTVKLVDGQVLLDIVSGALYSDINPRGDELERILVQPAKQIVMTRVTDSVHELYHPSEDDITYLVVPGSVFNLELSTVTVGTGRLAVKLGSDTYEVYGTSPTTPIGVKDVYTANSKGYITVKFTGDRMVKV